MPFDLDRLRRAGFLAQVDWHETLGSTNDRALKLAEEESLATPLLVLAEEQTAGRGRGSNRWWSGAGALTFSLVIEPDQVGTPLLRSEHWPRVALCAGVALCESLGSLAPHLNLGLKWPNDVQLAGKKIAGILVEIPPARPPVPRRLVVGMGVNLNNSLLDSPDEVRQVGTALCDVTGLEFDPTQLLLAWMSRFADLLEALSQDDPTLPGRWQSRCVLTGRTLELQSGDRLVRGNCLGIATDGALLLETPSGRESIYGGVLVRG
ncbi:MAG: biotin--[acetyl-CoA-carboxylase] ligase [Planctomycetales bacterium]